MKNDAESNQKVIIIVSNQTQATFISRLCRCYMEESISSSLAYSNAEEYTDHCDVRLLRYPSNIL